MIATLLAILAFFAVGFGTVNIGGARLQAPALVAGSMAQVNLRDMDPGYVDCFYVHLGYGLLSTGAAFNASVSSGAAEGADDLDKLLNAFFSSTSLYWESGNVAWNGLTPAQLRTALILFNRKDLLGTFINGVSVPISSGAATTFRTTLRIPVSLAAYFTAGDVFGSGTDRMVDGRFEFNVGPSLTPTVVLANGSAVVSGLQLTMEVQYSDGDRSDTGPTWRIRRPANLKATGEKFPAATRIGLFDMTANAATHVTAYSFLGYRNTSVAAMFSRFQSERLNDGGGYDLTARGIPLIFAGKDSQLVDFSNVAEAEWTWDVITSDSALTVMEIWSVGADSATASAVATKVAGGAGAPVTVNTIRSNGQAPGQALPSTLAGMVKTRATPGHGQGIHTAAGSVGGLHSAAQTAAKTSVGSRNTARARRR